MAQPPPAHVDSTGKSEPSTPVSIVGKVLRVESFSKHKGHRNLGIRGAVTLCHAALTLVLILLERNVPSAVATLCCQLVAAWSLVHQWKTADPHMFLVRASANYVRSLIVIHSAVCGGDSWIGTGCKTSPWGDVRRPLRVLQVLGSIRLCLNGLSLTLQYKFPWRGVGKYGNEQLFYRGIAQATGIPIHFARAMVKLGELSGTIYDRHPLEIAVHFVRCFVLIPISSWSLFDQWMTTGSGRKSDDRRTSHFGDISIATAETFGHVFDVHKGHRNLLIRGCVGLGQSIITSCLIFWHVDEPHTIPLLICQLFAAGTLIFQWRTGDPWMFVLRAFSAWARCLISYHQAHCGRKWVGTVCDDEGLNDIRVTFRIIHVIASIRMFLNGMSLFLQFCFPKRGVTARRGNEQLFYRGMIQGSGTPIHLARGILKMALLAETKYERIPVEIACNFIRALVLIPIASGSLFHQWLHTGTGAKDDPRTRRERTFWLSDDETLDATASGENGNTDDQLEVTSEVPSDSVSCDPDFPESGNRAAEDIKPHLQEEVKVDVGAVPLKAAAGEASVSDAACKQEELSATIRL